MKLTKTNNETKTVTAHSLYLDYIKKVILGLSDFTSWTFKTVSFGNVEPYEISGYTLNNSYAIINLSQKTIEIKSLGGTKNLYLFDNQLLYGLTIRLEKLKTSSNNYDFVLSLKNMISDDLSKSFWEGTEPSFSTQEGKFQNLIPMNMFSYINPNFKDKDLFDDDILEIIRTLFQLGINKTINEDIDFDTAELIASEFSITLELKPDQTNEEKLMQMIEELDRYKLYKNQIATLSTMIDRVIRLKNFDMVDRTVLKERDIKYIKIAEAIQDKLNELLVR